MFEAVPGLNTLIDFRYTQHFRAPRGQGGSGSNMTGGGGEDLVVKVPVGTQVLADDEERTALDVVVLRDGREVAASWALNEAVVEKASRERMIEVVEELASRSAAAVLTRPA